MPGIDRHIDGVLNGVRRWRPQTLDRRGAGRKKHEHDYGSTESDRPRVASHLRVSSLPCKSLNELAAGGDPHPWRFASGPTHVLLSAAELPIKTNFRSHPPCQKAWAYVVGSGEDSRSLRAKPRRSATAADGDSSVPPYLMPIL